MVEVHFDEVVGSPKIGHDFCRHLGGLPEVSDYSQGSMANIEAPLLSQDDDIPGLVKGQYALRMLM